MSLQNLGEELAVVATIDPDAYGTGDQSSDVIDMAHFREVIFVVQAGTLGTSATIDFKVYGDTASNGAFSTQITGKEITQLTDAGTDSDKQAIVRVTAEEVMAQGKRYIKGVMSVGAATSDAGVVALASALRYSAAADYDLASVDEIVN